MLDAKVTKTKSRYLWLEHPPGLGIPAGGGKKRRQRDGGGEGGSAMETEESGALRAPLAHQHALECPARLSIHSARGSFPHRA